MKALRMLKTAAVVLMVICITIPMAVSAKEQNYDILDDWGIAVSVPEGYTGGMYGEENEYYIFTEEEGYIPYVMVCYFYGFDSKEDLGDFVISNLTAAYPDAELVLAPQNVLFGDKTGYEFDFQYSLDGSAVLDRRVLVNGTDKIFMFVSKELTEENQTVGTLLEDTIENCILLPEFADGSYDTSVVPKLGSMTRQDDTKGDIPLDESDLPSMYWYDYSQGRSTSGMGGRFEKFEEQGVELFIPDEYQRIELGPEYDGLYYLAYYSTDPGTMKPAIAVQLIDSLGIETMEDYRKTVESLGDYVSIEGEIMLNGQHCLGYQIPGTGALVIGTVLDDGVLEISFVNGNEDDLMDISELVSASFRELPEVITPQNNEVNAGTTSETDADTQTPEIGGFALQLISE